MSTVLRRLVREPNGSLAAQAFIAAQNFIRTGLATEDEIRARLIKTSALTSQDAEEAIERGFAAARMPS
jgi:hypothetical protein